MPQLLQADPLKPIQDRVTAKEGAIIAGAQLTRIIWPALQSRVVAV